MQTPNVEASSSEYKPLLEEAPDNDGGSIEMGLGTVRSSKLDFYIWNLLMFKSQNIFFFLILTLYRPDKTCPMDLIRPWTHQFTALLPVCSWMATQGSDLQIILTSPLFTWWPLKVCSKPQDCPRGWDQLTRWLGIPKMAACTHPIAWGLAIGFGCALHLLQRLPAADLYFLAPYLLGGRWQVVVCTFSLSNWAHWVDRVCTVAESKEMQTNNLNSKRTGSAAYQRLLTYHGSDLFLNNLKALP